MLSVMPRSRRGDTRAQLLLSAEAMINRQGFAATSIDQIIDEVGVTKGSFFYHFKSKNDLAFALIESFAERDQEVLHSCFERACRLTDAPKERLLVFVGLLLEVAEQLDQAAQPGCLFATYCYESGLFEQRAHEVIQGALLNWRARILELLEAAAREHPPRVETDLASLADMATVLFEGAFVYARVFGPTRMFTGQVLHYRNYLRLLFA